MDILLFILVSVGFILVPGPNILVIISTSITNGKIRGLQTISGTSIAMAIQLFVAAVGTAWFVEVLASGFSWLKWAGALYLLYLGLKHLLIATSKMKPKPLTATSSFQRGFWISLTNPKTILFFSAFLPQFVSLPDDYLVQIAQLSLIFWMLATAIDTGYALIASRLVTLLGNKKLPVLENYLSGFLYLGAGVTLAATKDG